jgi:hypothetical protein
MRVFAVVALIAATLGACAQGGLFRQYEYEEDMYLALDGSATLYVNSSLAALNMLRGASFDTNPATPVDRDAVRTYFTTPHTRVTRVAVSRRANRRFVHVRMDVDDVRRMGSVSPFAWSRYRLDTESGVFVFRQTVGASAAKGVGDVGWTGRELVAFRLHLPSRIVYHNAGTNNLKRGNILVWEQPLAARRDGEPLALDARMETQSILYRTLFLFSATVVAVAVAFALLVWWLLRRNAKANRTMGTRPPRDAGRPEASREVPTP